MRTQEISICSLNTIKKASHLPFLKHLGFVVVVCLLVFSLYLLAFFLVSEEVEWSV